MRIVKLPINSINVNAEIICRIIDAEAKKFGCRFKWDGKVIFIGDNSLMKHIIQNVKELFKEIT